MIQTMSLEIRKAVEENADGILGLIHGIAEYGKLGHHVRNTEEFNQNNMFGRQPFAHCFMAYRDGKLARYELYFFNLSTFPAKPACILRTYL